MTGLVEAMLFSTLDYAPALVFGALGATLSERSGVVNVGVEGMMRAGALGAAIAALFMPTPWAVAVGMALGGTFAGVHAWLCIEWKSEQVVSGMALNLLALALGSFVLEAWYSPGGTPPITQLSRWELPGVSSLPVLRAVSHHSGLTYLALLLPFFFHLFLWKTPAGLRVRAVGEHPMAAATMGISVSRVRHACVLASGLLAGLGGACLSTSTLDRFEHHMPAGLGFMAVAAMVFGRWTPLGAFGAALFFSLGNAARIALSSSARGVLEAIPGGVWLALPYLLTLLLLSFSGKRTVAPAALGQPFPS